MKNLRENCGKNMVKKKLTVGRNSVKKEQVWRFYIRDSSGNTLYTTDVSANPYSPKDLQAAAETSDSHIRLDGTHFKYISYYYGRSWPLWNMHVNFTTGPYRLTQVSNSEFYASGGG